MSHSNLLATDCLTRKIDLLILFQCTKNDFFKQQSNLRYRIGRASAVWVMKVSFFVHVLKVPPGIFSICVGFVSRNGSTVAFRLSHYSGQIKSKVGDGTSEQKTPQSSTETPKKCSAGLLITRDVVVGALLSLPWACSTSASSGRQGHRLRLR